MSPEADRLLELHTPYGHPVAWADVAMVSDAGDSHDLNDDRCLVITSRDLGEQATGPLRDFMLCLLADGATGSTFRPEAERSGGSIQAGWRASQLAQAAFVERFLTSDEADVLDRLKDGMRAADRALVESGEGSLSTTMTALFLAADGTAYAASIGDSVLLVLPPSRRTPADRRLKKLGYETTTAVGSGDTTLSYVDEAEIIEQWWPNKEGGPGSPRVKPGTYFVLMSDGISDNLPIERIDQLVHRHSLDRSTVGLPRQTREQRAVAQKRVGGSTSQLGLDNMSAVVVRFTPGAQVGFPAPPVTDATLLTLHGTHGGPMSGLGGPFGVVCLAGQELVASVVPRFLRALIESEHTGPMDERLNGAFAQAAPGETRARLAAVALDTGGSSHAFSGGWVDPPALCNVRITRRVVAAARDSALQRFVYSPRLWASTLAAMAVFLLVSTAFATGTVRPAPPPISTVAPGRLTPTPDTRPKVSIGDFQLVAPATEATPTPAPPALTDTPESADPPSEDTPPAPPGPAKPPARSNRGSPNVVPVPSPAPVGADASVDTGPPAGSNLDRALRIASVANDQFNRSLQEPVSNSDQSGQSEQSGN